MERERLLGIADLLEKVATGKITGEEALQLWPSVETETDQLLRFAWHDLSHYAVDFDIRAKDPRYAAYQNQLLSDRAHAIRLRSESDDER